MRSFADASQFETLALAILADLGIDVDDREVQALVTEYAARAAAKSRALARRRHLSVIDGGGDEQ